MVLTSHWKMKSTFVKLQNLLFKFKFPSFWRTLSKYGMKHQVCEKLCVEQKSKIWCKNIHAFLRNCDFRVGAFYFDAPCISYRMMKYRRHLANVCKVTKL